VEPEAAEDKKKEPIYISDVLPRTPERVLRAPDVELPEAIPPKPVAPEQPVADDKQDSAEYIGKSVLGAVRVVKVLFEAVKKYSQFETMYRIYLRERYAALAGEKEELLAMNEMLRADVEKAEARLKELEKRIALQKRDSAPKDAGQADKTPEPENGTRSGTEDSGTAGSAADAAGAAEPGSDKTARSSKTAGGERETGSPAPAGREGPAAGPEEDAEWKRKHVYAVPEDVIAISMGGTGWIYLGERDKQKGITFKARKNSSRATEFVFQTEKLGEYHLQFQQQDLFTGEERWQEVRVSVVKEERFAEILSAKQSGEEKDPEIIDASPKGYILADTYYKEGREKEALAEYLKNYTEGDPRINERIAHLSFEQEKYEQAELYWRKNLYEDGIYREKAVAGIIRTAVRLEDVNVFEKMLPELLAIDTIPTDEPLLEGARFQIEKGNTVSAANILESFLTRYYDHEKADWAYFTLGNLHEKAGPLRDFKKAKYYYRVVLNDFPASSYWDRAEERIRYIDMYLLKAQ
jgi:TolA-binding protein